MPLNKNFDFLNNELNKIQNFYSNKDYDTVIVRAKKLIRKYPNVIPFYNAIGLAYSEKREFGLAKKYLDIALNLNPNDSNVLNNLGLIYKALDNIEEAENYFEKSIKFSKKNFVARLNLGHLKRNLNDSISAINLYTQAIAINDNRPEAYLALADIYKSIGKYDKAREYGEKISKKFPNLTDQDLLLSKIVNYEEENSHQNLMLNKIQKKDLNLSNKIDLNFAIAKSFEDQKKFDKSIIYLDSGNSLKKSTQKKYDVTDDEIFFSKIVDVFSKYKGLPPKRNFDYPKRIIFIVGLPRSGTTLLHQIISNNKNVFGAGEMVFFNEPFAKLFSESMINGEIINQFEQITNNFYDKLKQLKIKQDIIVEKTPGNFFWLGLLKYLFPNSKIIHSQRNINDTAFSIYKNLFAENSYKWAYNKDNIVQYIALYKKIMQFWFNEFGDDIFNSDYLELINNPTEQTKKIFKFCDLEWNDAAIQIQDSKVSIDTLSATQARKPINKKSINFYKNYKHLTDLFDKLDSIA